MKNYGNYTDTKDLANKSNVDSKQDILVSGTNIKTINGTSVLGSGNISVTGGSESPLSADVYYYVYTTGSDSNDGLTNLTPLLTLQAALDKVPKDLGGFDVYVEFGNGTFPNSVLIKGFHNGTIYLDGNSDTNLGTIIIEDCTANALTLEHIKTSTTITLKNSANVAFDAPTASAIMCYNTTLSIWGGTAIGTLTLRNGSHVDVDEYATITTLSGYGGSIFTGYSWKITTNSFSGIFHEASTIASMLMADRTRYVNGATGSDTGVANGNSSGTPLLTITEALRRLPKNLGGKTATITVAAWATTYSAVVIDGFYNGTLQIIGNTTTITSRNLSSILITNCTAQIVIQDFTVNSNVSYNSTTSGVAVDKSNDVTISNVSINTNGSQGLYVINKSNVYFNGSGNTIASLTNGITCFYGARVTANVGTFTVSAGYGLRAATCGVIQIENKHYTSQIALSGGLIIMGGGGVVSSSIPIINKSTSSQTGFSADTYLTGSRIVFPTPPVAGTRYKCVFDVTKTAAGTATPIINVRVGTAGTTSDTSRGALTFGAGTATIDVGVFEVIVSFRTAGSGTTAVVQSIARLTSNLTTTGLSNAKKAVVVTSGGFDSTVANLGIGLSYNGGTSASHTIQLVSAELIM